MNDPLDTQSEPFEPSDWREFLNQLTPNEDQERMLNELQMIWDAVDRGGEQIGEDLWGNSQPPRPDTLINQNVALVDPTSQHIQYAYAERPKNSMRTLRSLRREPQTSTALRILFKPTSERV